MCKLWRIHEIWFLLVFIFSDLQVKGLVAQLIQVKDASTATGLEVTAGGKVFFKRSIPFFIINIIPYQNSIPHPANEDSLVCIIIKTCMWPAHFVFVGSMISFSCSFAAVQCCGGHRSHWQEVDKQRETETPLHLYSTKQNRCQNTFQWCC